MTTLHLTLFSGNYIAYSKREHATHEHHDHLGNDTSADLGHKNKIIHNTILDIIQYSRSIDISGLTRICTGDLGIRS